MLAGIAFRLLCPWHPSAVFLFPPPSSPSPSPSSSLRFRRFLLPAHTRTPAHYPYTAAPCRGARAPVRLPLSLSHSPTFFGIVVTWGPLHCPLVVVSVHRRKHKVIRYNKVPGRRASCRRRRASIVEFHRLREASEPSTFIRTNASCRCSVGPKNRCRFGRAFK